MCSYIPTSSADTSYVNGALCLVRRIDHYILPRDEQTDTIAAPRLLIVQLVLLRHKRKILLDRFFQAGVPAFSSCAVTEHFDDILKFFCNIVSRSIRINDPISFHARSQSRDFRVKLVLGERAVRRNICCAPAKLCVDFIARHFIPGFKRWREGHTALAEALCQAFGHLHTPEVYAADYRRLCLNLGQTLRIPDTGETVTALDIDRQYGLVVRRRDGTVDTLRCGEVSVRGLYGYV